MHAVVCIKQVPDTSEVRIDPVTNTLIREGVPSIVNPYDAHAVEEALRLRDTFGGKVTVISMGPPQAKEALRKAISWGADRAILLSDRAFAGSDTLATSYVLAGAIRKVQETEAVDIVLCGKQAIDGDTGQVGPGIATRLGWPLLTYVAKIEGFDLEERKVRVWRLLEDTREVVRTRLPVLITVVQDINQVRYASLTNMMRAARYQVETWNKDSLPLDEKRMGLNGSPTTVRRVFPPPTRAEGEIIPSGTSNPEESARELVEKLLRRLTLNGEEEAKQ